MATEKLLKNGAYFCDVSDYRETPGSVIRQQGIVVGKDSDTCTFAVPKHVPIASLTTKYEIDFGGGRIRGISITKQSMGGAGIRIQALLDSEPEEGAPHFP